jgi:hypothetical protein
MSSADDQYEQQNDQVTGDAPSGNAVDNDYVSRPGQKQAPIPVQSDETPVNDPIDPATADSDEQLGKNIPPRMMESIADIIYATTERDESEAIDQSNVIDSRTRGAKPSGSYEEPGDEEGLPTNDGTSRVAQ